MGAEGPWQLWLWGLGWPAVLAALALSLPRRWLPRAAQPAALAGWGGLLVALAWMALRPPPPLWVWRPGGAGGEALAFALRADPLGLGLAAACVGLGLLVQASDGRAAEPTRGALGPLVGLFLAFLGGNLFTYAVGCLLWEVSWAAGEGDLRRGRGFPGGVGVLLILLLVAPASARLAFGGEEWPTWVRAGAALAGLWTAGVYPAVGPMGAAEGLPRGMRTLAWTVQPALGLVLVARVWAQGTVPGGSALVVVLLLCALFAAFWAGEASLARLAATRAALLALGVCVAPGASRALPWAVLGFGLGLFLLEGGFLRSRFLDAGWARALALLALAGFPLTPAFSWPVAGAASATLLWWLGLANAFALAPFVGEDRSPVWRLRRPSWQEVSVALALAGLGALALAFGPRVGWAEGAKAVGSVLGGGAGAVALAWLRRQVPLVERLARGAARAVDPLAWARSIGGVGGKAGDGLRWALSLWEGRAALLWGMALVGMIALALGW